MLNVNFGTGAGNYDSELELEELMEEVKENAAYTQIGIEILDESENQIAYLPWYGVKAEDEDNVTVDYGDNGFYGEWVIN